MMTERRQRRHHRWAGVARTDACPGGRRGFPCLL